MAKLVSTVDYEGNRIFINVDRVKYVQEYHDDTSLVFFGPNDRIVVKGDIEDVMAAMEAN